MKKNSFTLIELIGVLLILGTISLIIVPNVLKSINDANSLASEEQLAAIKEASLNYSVKNDLGYYNDYEKVISFDDLINGGFLTEKDIKAKDGNRLPGCVIYKWLDNSKQYNFRYDAECNPLAPTVQIAFNVLGNAINSNGWASSEFYVQVNVNNANSYKWCSTTSDTCNPTTLVTKNTNSVLISSNSLTNKICIQAKNVNDEEQEITCSDNYKLDSSLPNIASNSNGYIVVTPTTSINVIDYFNYSASGLSNIKSTRCKNTTANQDITETSSLSIGDYNIECTATTESGVSNSANITLSISNCFNFGSSSITDYYCYVGNTGGYREISNVTIPYSINKNLIKTIGFNAFYQNQLTSVSIPNSITSIEGQAFAGNQLTGVIIPNSVTNIGYSAFYHNQLTSLTIPNSIKNINSMTFQSNQLTSVTIPNSVTSIGSLAFSGNQLVSVIIGNSVTNIGLSAFSFNQLTSVTIPDSVTIIDDVAFYTNKLTSLTIPNGVTSIGHMAFQSNRLTSVTIGNSVTSIGSDAFEQNQLTSVTIPNSVTSIGDSAFEENQLTSVTIPNSVTSIGSSSFSSNQLTSLTIGNSVTSIGAQAFAGNLFTSVIIPASVTNISGNPFSGSLLTSITVDSNNLNYKSINNAIYTIDGTKLVTGNKNISNSIESSVTEIGSYAFNGNQLASVTIPNSVITISSYAFQYNKLTSVTIPNSVTSIGNWAFQSNQLTSVTIPNSVTSIGDSAFILNKLSTITLGTCLTSIGSSTFNKYSTYNPITTIYNNSGKSFDWTGITGSSTTGQSFVTGTITHQSGNITVTTN